MKTASLTKAARKLLNNSLVSVGGTLLTDAHFSAGNVHLANYDVEIERPLIKTAQIAPPPRNTEVVVDKEKYRVDYAWQDKGITFIHLFI